MNLEEIIKELKKNGTRHNIQGMNRFGIITKDIKLGVDASTKKILVKKLKNIYKSPLERHKLAAKLWKTKIHEARIMSALLDDPNLLTGKQMDSWTKVFDNWALCDSVCGHFFSYSPLAYKKCFEYAKSNKEFVRRTGFALMACLAVHDKKRPDADFVKFFPLIKKYSTDERNFVKKAVNWALRQIGKRNENLCRQAINLSNKVVIFDSKSARWVAKDALRELKIHLKREE